MKRLSAILKNIIVSRLYDTGIRDIKEINEYLDNFIYDDTLFQSYEELITVIVNNYGKTIIC